MDGGKHSEESNGLLPGMTILLYGKSGFQLIERWIDWPKLVYEMTQTAYCVIISV